MAGGLQPIQTDEPPPCAFCGAPSAGPCATCMSMLCADCGILTGGTIKKVVVCPTCNRKGRGTVGRHHWIAILTPILIGIVVLVGLTLVLQAC